MARHLTRLALVLGLCLIAVIVPAPARSAPARGLIQVNTFFDELEAAGCSLREAILAANTDAAVSDCPAGDGDDTILLPSGTYTLTIPGQNEDLAATGDLDVIGNLTIQGDSRTLTLIDGGGLDRAIDVRPGANLAVIKATVRNGFLSASGVGGGINVSGRLVLDSVTIEDNEAGWGAGVNVFGIGTALIENSTFENNHAVNTGGGFLAYDGANVTVATSRFFDNHAAYGGGLGVLGRVSIFSSEVYGGSAQTSGGGIYVGPTGDLTASHLELYDLQADFGAAIAMLGRAEIEDMTSYGNEGDIGAGAAIATTGFMTITRSTFENNKSITGTVINNGHGWYAAVSFIHNEADFGGGMANYGTANLTNVTISDNDSTKDGGGLYNVTGNTWLANVTIFGNTAGVHGGGIFNRVGASVYSRNSIIGGNDNTDSQTPDCSGTLQSEGYNLIVDPTGCIIAGTTTGNITSPANLGPLEDNGGHTVTHLPEYDSPAIDAGNAGGCTFVTGGALLVDQRGATRHFDGDSTPGARCDMGAAEYGAVLYELWLPELLSIIID